MWMMIKIGWRNLWRNKRRSFIMLGALVIGLWGVIMMYGANNGYMVGMLNLALESHTAHVQIHAEGYNDNPEIKFAIEDPAEILSEIKSIEHIMGVSPRGKVRGMLTSARGSSGITLVGIDPAGEAAVSTVAEGIKDGRYFNPDDERGALIGQSLAEKLKVKPGRKLVVYARGADDELKTIGLKVTGIFNTGNEMVDKYMAFVPLSYFQSQLALGDKVHEIAIRVDDDINLAVTKDAVDQAVSGIGGIETFTWRDKWAFLVQLLDFAVIGNYIILGIVVIAISLGVANTIIMSVFERFREIGIMRAVGTTPFQIFVMVIIESVSMAVTGLLLGSGVSYLTLVVWNQYGLDLSAYQESLAAYASPSVIYPVVRLSDWVVTWVVVLILAMGSSLYPAIKAARKNPVEAIREAI